MLIAVASLHQAGGSDASLAELRERARTTQLVILTADKGVVPEFVPAPLFRYSDQLRHIEDAGVWVWTRGGRPEAVMKVERYTVGILPRPWLYCFASVSPNLLVAEWNGDPAFKSQAPGIQWQALTDKAVDSRALRLAQMRDIARRFSAELIGRPDGSERRQMRLIPRPLFRSPETLAEGGDAAVFGFSGTGTNPDLLLLLDLLPAEGWRFGLAGMTAEGLVVRLGDKKVWEAEHTAGKGQVFDTWTGFFTNNISKTIE